MSLSCSILQLTSLIQPSVLTFPYETILFSFPLGKKEIAFPFSFFISFWLHSTRQVVSTMFSSTEPVIHTPTDQVSVTIVRKSDGHSMTFVLNEKTHIHELKRELKQRLKPQFEEGCRLIFRGKVLKGRYTLKHYGIKKGVNDQAIASMLTFKNKLFSLKTKILFIYLSGRYKRLEIIIIIRF